MHSAKFLFIILVALSFVSTSFAANSYATTGRSIASVSAPLFAQETELVAEIDRQADVVFKKFVEDSDGRIPLSTLQKAQLEVVYRLKQMHVLTDILKASGPAPATTLLATEILSNFVLAPLATAFGKPAVAGVMITVPWGVVAGFGVFSFQLAKQRFLIARSLGRYSLRSLDKVRKLVVGYDIKYRVSSSIYQDLNQNVTEFEILKKGLNLDSAKMPSLLVSELEGMVRSAPEGVDYLESIHMEKLDPSFYSALLLLFINDSEELTSKLVSLVRDRSPLEKASEDPFSIRRHLMGVDDVQMQIDRSIKNLQIEKAGLKKRLKSGDVLEFEAARIKAHAVKEIVRLREVRDRLVRHEYSVLTAAELRLSAGESPASLTIEASRATELVSLALEAYVKPAKSAVIDVGAARSTAAERVRAVIRAVSAQPLTCSDLFL
jgi:hypothetical protein